MTLRCSDRIHTDVTDVAPYTWPGRFRLWRPMYANAVRSGSRSRDVPERDYVVIPRVHRGNAWHQNPASHLVNAAFGRAGPGIAVLIDNVERTRREAPLRQPPAHGCQSVNRVILSVLLA